VKSVNSGMLFSTLYSHSGTRMAVDSEFGGVYRDPCSPDPSSGLPKNQKTTVPAHMRIPPPQTRESGSHQSPPLRDPGVEGQRGSKRGFESRVVVVRRLGATVAEATGN
jgi:hypothetical protein